MQSTPACRKKTYAGLEKGSGILLFLFLFISSNAEITIMTKMLPVSVSCDHSGALFGFGRNKVCRKKQYLLKEHIILLEEGERMNFR